MKRKQRNKTTAPTEKNLSRYTYETTSFLGWRVTIQRGWKVLTKYFSDRAFGGDAEKSREAALAYRDLALKTYERTGELCVLKQKTWRKK